MSDWCPSWLRRDPHPWAPGTLDRQGLYAEAHELAASPHFGELARAFAASWLSTQDDNPALRAVLRNSARYSLLVLCLVLHHRRDAADALSGITPSRVLEMFDRVSRRRIEAGESQVKAILAHARTQGLLAPRAGPGDARFRPLDPTARLTHAMQQWVAGFLRPLQGVRPLPVAPDELVAQPGLVGEVFSLRVAAQQDDGFLLTDDHPAMRWMMSRDRGYRLFLQLVRAMDFGADGRATVALSANELARRAGVARATVVQLLEDLRAYGWLEPGAGPRPSIAMDARHVTLALQWIALEMVWMRGLSLVAWRHRRARPR
ncbi:MAG: helix-turn-helix domain-containing protein [Rubrivivax sp.]